MLVEWRLGSEGIWNGLWFLKAIFYSIQKNWYREFLIWPHWMIMESQVLAANILTTAGLQKTAICFSLVSAWKMLLYSFLVTSGKDIVDCLNILDPNDWIWMYQHGQCYQTTHAQFCVSCVSSRFMYDCRACSDCFYVRQLRNKRYRKKRWVFKRGIWKNHRWVSPGYFAGQERAQKEYDEFLLTYPRKYAMIT